MKTDNTIFLMGRIREKANQQILREMAKMGLTNLAPSHGDVLVHLYRLEKVPMAQLSFLIRRDPSTVTALVGKLKKLGYVQTEKDSEDSRVTLVSLTETGKAFQKDFDRISADLCAAEYRGFTEKEKEALQKLLTKVNDNFG